MYPRPLQTSHFSNTDLTIGKLYDVCFVRAVITAGGTGIGLIITQALQSNGATVYITGRRKEALDVVVNQHSTGPWKIIALPGYISQKEKCVRLAGEPEPSTFPKPTSTIFSKAFSIAQRKFIHRPLGIARDDNTKSGQPESTTASSVSDLLLSSRPSQWAETFSTNVTAQFFMSAAFILLLAKATASTPGYSSCITNISSVSGLMKNSSNNQFAYASNKAALVHSTRMLAMTLMDLKIRVNQIAPGIFPSETTTNESDEQQKSELSSTLSNPAGKSSQPKHFRPDFSVGASVTMYNPDSRVTRATERGGSDADMAASILFLVSRAGLFYNNQLLHPDGGQILKVPAAL